MKKITRKWFFILTGLISSPLIALVIFFFIVNPFMESSTKKKMIIQFIAGFILKFDIEKEIILEMKQIKRDEQNKILAKKLP